MFKVAYTTEDFQKLKMYRLNPEQLLALMKAGSDFLEKAPPEKVIECLKHFQKSRGIKVYKGREEVMQTVRYLTLNHHILARLSRQSYVTSLVHAISRMRIDDEQVWASIGAYLA